MGRWYRLAWYDPAAPDPSVAGHPLYLWPRQGQGRCDDPQGEYLVRYLGRERAGAVAEVFGDFATWGTDLLEPPAGQPQLRRAVIGYDLDADLCDLDDAGTLLERGLRPSQVVTRDRDVTQTWSRAIHDDGRYGGVSWWSYRDPRWTVAATWAHDAIRLAEVRQLDLDDEAFREAAEVLLRPVV